MVECVEGCGVCIVSVASEGKWVCTFCASIQVAPAVASRGCAERHEHGRRGRVGGQANRENAASVDRYIRGYEA